MTPPAVQLQFHLDQRYLWFLNQWLFKWHHINRGPVEIDMFDGRHAHLGGIAYDGSARITFWDAIVRGVRKDVIDRLAWLDAEVRRYNDQTAHSAIDECAVLLSAFVAKIRRAAVEKDRLLRGDGMNIPKANDAGRWDGLSQAEVTKLAEGIATALPHAPEPERLNATSQDGSAVEAADAGDSDARVYLDAWLGRNADLARREFAKSKDAANGKMSLANRTMGSAHVLAITKLIGDIVDDMTKRALVEADRTRSIVDRHAVIESRLELILDEFTQDLYHQFTPSHLPKSDILLKLLQTEVDRIRADIADMVRLHRLAGGLVQQSPQIDTAEDHFSFWLEHHGNLARREFDGEIRAINAEMAARKLLRSGGRISRIARTGAEIVNRHTEGALAKAATEVSVSRRCDILSAKLSELVDYVRVQVDKAVDMNRTGDQPDFAQREAANKLVDQIANDLAAAIRLALPSLVARAAPASNGTRVDDMPASAMSPRGRGRKKGDGSFDAIDAPLLEEMDRLITDGQAISANAAASLVADGARGASREATIDRLARKYRDWARSGLK